jgi:hypothetical protein
LLRGGIGVIIAGALLLFLFAARNQSHVYLESFSKKFKGDIIDERGYHGNFKIGSGNNISDCPSYTPFSPMPERSNSPIKRLE